MNKLKIYLSPDVEIVELKVEQGFAISNGGDGWYNGDEMSVTDIDLS